MNRYLCTCALFVALLLIALPATGKKFAGRNCASDCSENIAGYLWAEGHNILDPDECMGNSRSFIEGCRAYALGESFYIEDEDEKSP